MRRRCHRLSVCMFLRPPSGVCRYRPHRNHPRRFRFPSHTLRANVDYGFAEARTVYGLIGVKCWICCLDPGANAPLGSFVSLSRILTPYPKEPCLNGLHATQVRKQTPPARPQFAATPMGGRHLAFGDYGIQCLGPRQPQRPSRSKPPPPPPAWANQPAIPTHRSPARSWIRVFFQHKPITKKPAETRPGKR